MHNLLKIVFIISLHSCPYPLVSGQDPPASEIYCNKEWCETDPDIPKCNLDKPLNCSTIGFREILAPTTCNCCEYCFNYLVEGDACQTVAASTVPPTHLCGPLLECQIDRTIDEDKCAPMRKEQGPCVKELRVYEENVIKGTVGIAQLIPDCDAHGFYNPRQCMPGSMCFCMSDIGERLFGVGPPTEPMDCACSRDVARIKSFGFDGTFPHCLSNGDYDELQCNVYTRRCYCMSKPDTSVAIQNIAKLPCYKRGLHPAPPDTPYLRPCELESSGINFDIMESQFNDSSVMASDKPRCAPDGYYDLVQSRNQKWICTDKNGIQIESFEAEKIGPTPGDMNCFCALTWSLSSSSAGKPKCCPNGNYNGWQCSGSTCYCVDKLGRQNMEYEQVSLDFVDRLPCFADPCESIA